ncbi:MAG: MFS transporter [Pseudomonadota bacterium]
MTFDKAVHSLAFVTAASDPRADAKRRVVGSVWTKLIYGFGFVATGVKGNGFNYFLLLFYSQALGVGPERVGLAIAIVFLFDAFSDPIVGYLSDNLRTPWGRRHPLMYASILPVCLGFYMLWNPPVGASEDALFVHLLVFSIIVRTAITFFEVPALALVPEFTDDYDERTSFLSYRAMFMWLGGVTVSVVALLFLLDDSATGSGFTDVDGFRDYGLMASTVMFGAMLICAAGTHRTIPHLRGDNPGAGERYSLGRIFREMKEAVSNPSFAPLFISYFFASLASGLSAALSYYILGYFWGFTSVQTGLITAAIALSSVAAWAIAPRAARWLGKKRAVIILGVVAFTVAPAPVALRLLGLMPGNDSSILFPLILSITMMDYALIIATQIIKQSMVADLVEDSQVRTARRSEGVFFAGVSFMQKVVSGGGVLIAGVALAIVDFPEGAQPSEVGADALFRLGVFYAPTMFTLWMIMLGCIYFYRIDRADHEANIAKLKAKEGAN